MVASAGVESALSRVELNSSRVLYAFDFSWLSQAPVVTISSQGQECQEELIQNGICPCL